MIKPLPIMISLFLCLQLRTGIVAAHPEQLLMQALDAIGASEFTKAEQVLKTLIHDEPDFKLAHMLYGDVLKAKSGSLGQAGMGIIKGEDLEALLNEVRSRYTARQPFINGEGKIPATLSRLDDSYQYAIVVDLKQSRLFVFENIKGLPVQVADYYISMGRGGAEKEKEGDLRTPLGVYFVQSYMPSEKLDDKYGAGAYPINYPNAWDSFNGRTGGGIWLHGTQSGTYNRPPLASEGCVVLPNDDLIELGAYIKLKQTPVLIGNDIEWLSVEQWRQNNSDLTALFTQWVNDWQSLDTDKYLSHYSQQFDNGEKSYPIWVAHKKRIAKNKAFIKVNVSDISLLKHPNDDVLVVTFNQSYRSSNYSSDTRKRQYWHKEKDGQWRIIYEGEIAMPENQRLALDRLKRR